MTARPSRILTAVPQSWPVRQEIAKAIRALATQDEQEKHRLRRAELAAFRRDCELLAEAIREVCRDFDKAGFNPNEPRVPAGNPDDGQWTSADEDGNETSSHAPTVSDATPDDSWTPGAQYAANDPPGGRTQGPSLGEPPAVPAEQPESTQAINTFLKAAAYFLAGVILAGEPIGDFLLAMEAADWLSQYRPLVYSYLDPPKTLQQLRQAALIQQAGYNVHHIVEQTPAAQDGFPRSLVDGPDNLVLVPTLKHWLISAWFATQNDDFGGLSPREYLRGKSWDERLRVGKDALALYGVLEP